MSVEYLDETKFKLIRTVKLRFRDDVYHIGRVAFSPDGKRIVWGSYDKTIKVWDIENNQLIFENNEEIEYGELVSSVAFSPDGKRIASGSWDEIIRVWDIESGEVKRYWDETLDIEDPDTISSVAFSPDGKRIVSGIK